MASSLGRTDPPLEDVLFEEPYRFDFFQAVRLLGLMRPDRAPVGLGGEPGREVARFLVRQSLGFPASPIHSLERAEGSDDPPAMTVAFMGLTGPLGVLPRFYTELMIARLRAGDRSPSAFFDLFNHRLISLFYRAWEKYRFIFAYERGRGDLFSDCLYDLMGLGSEPLRDRHAFPDDVLLYYAGAFSSRHRPAVVLEGVMVDYFKVPVEVVQFVGRWLGVDPEDRTRLGASGAHNELGANFVMGNRIWDEQGTIRLRIGPLSFDQFLSFQPEERAYQSLVQMARLYVGAGFNIQVQLVLRADEVPEFRLGSAARLGRYSWLKVRDSDGAGDKCVLVGRG
jgi:type VI secretion system protein ImpH